MNAGTKIHSLLMYSYFRLSTKKMFCRYRTLIKMKCNSWFDTYENIICQWKFCRANFDHSFCYLLMNTMCMFAQISLCYLVWLFFYANHYIFMQSCLLCMALLWQLNAQVHGIRCNRWLSFNIDYAQFCLTKLNLFFFFLGLVVT